MENEIFDILTDLLCDDITKIEAMDMLMLICSGDED